MKDSLLLDGGNEDPSINLKKVMFWPDNIIELFRRFEVREHFDLLSVDMDSYDWFILERILEHDYRPRVIIIECNTMFDLEDSKSVMPPGLSRDYTTNTTGLCHGIIYIIKYTHFMQVIQDFSNNDTFGKF